MKPGKKGISLTVPQFSALIELLPDIEKSLLAKNQAISRPEYHGETKTEGSDHHEIDGSEVKELDAGMKKNFEETSEED